MGRGSRQSQLLAAALVAALGAGCIQGARVNSGATGESNGSATAIASAGAPGASTSGPSSSGGFTSSGSSTGVASTGGSSSAGATSSGSSTGIPPPPVVDGGYVFCSVEDSPSGGPDHDGGAASWMCPPGTYFCDLTDPPGNCLECRSDADCANLALPSHDRNRPRCDLASGVPGYQNFCQQCVDDADCAGNPAGSFCDLIPPASEAVQRLDLVGFETCLLAETDCRADGGIRCGFDQVCNPITGICVDLSGTCQTDADCAGDLFEGNQLTFCAQGMCSPCPGGICPPPCTSDSDCDAGLTCLTVNSTSACGISCTSPLAPPCPGVGQICDPHSGVCEPCSFGDGCQLAKSPSGHVCVQQDGTGANVCGCYASTDCPPDRICDTSLSCVPPSTRCSPNSCGGFGSCDMDAGMCVLASTGAYGQCLVDYDCAPDVCVAGSCVECRSDGECAGSPEGLHCFLPDGGLPPYRYNACGCAANGDCPAGETCDQYGYCSSNCYPSGQCPTGYFCDPSYACRPRCDWGSVCKWPDVACDLGNAAGQNGETFDGSIPGLIWCYPCVSSDDCPAGQGCDGLTHGCGSCGLDSECASSICADPVCLGPPCDAGTCACQSPIDCPGDQGCNSLTHTCGTCTGPSVAMTGIYRPPGDFCSNYWRGVGPGVCLQPCDEWPCPPDRPICEVFPSFSEDRPFCFGCLTDADCLEAGPGAWCDTHVNLTFTCQPPDGG